MAGFSQNAKVFYRSWINCCVAFHALILCSTCQFSHAQFGSTTEHQPVVSPSYPGTAASVPEQPDVTSTSVQFSVIASIPEPAQTPTLSSPQPEPYLIIANRDAIYRVNLDESDFQAVVNGSSLVTNTVAIDFDIRRNYLFWSDVSSKRIIRANLNGSEPEVLVDNGLTIADGLAWDWLNEKLYWTDSKHREIEVYDILTKHRKQLVQTGNGTTPRALVLDPNTRFLYWTDWGDVAKIERMSMDGTMRETLHSTSLSWPNGLTIDYTTQTLYWVDAKLDKIESSFVNGSNRRLVSTTFILHPFAVVFFDAVLYWSDWTFKQVVYAPLSSVENVVGLVPVLSNKPMGLRVVAMEIQPIAAANPCSESNCSDLCLLSASSDSSFSCQCPEGKVLDNSGTWCISDNTTAPPTTDVPPPTGSCRVAGYTSCCMITDGICEGASEGGTACFCDAGCVELDNCCDDFFDICPVIDPFSSVTMATYSGLTTPTPLVQVSSSDTSPQPTLSSTNILEVKTSHSFTPEGSTHSGSVPTSSRLDRTSIRVQTVSSSVNADITPFIVAEETGGVQTPLLIVVGVISVMFLLVLTAFSLVLFLAVWKRKICRRRNNVSSASFENFVTEESCKDLGDLSSRSPSFGESLDSGVSEV